MIHVSHLTKDYGTHRALDSLSFDIEKGEFVALLGPKGAGKTTTMRILAGYLAPTAGTVSIDGWDIVSKSHNAKSLLGYLPATIPVYDDMTIFEYLQYFGQIRRMNDLDHEIDAILGQLEISQYSESLTSVLPKDIQQKVGLAQACLHDPKVLFIDDPTANLDPQMAHEVQDLVKEVGINRTVFISTQSLTEAQQVCDRALLINNGQIVAQKSATEMEVLVSGSRQALFTLEEATEALPELLMGFEGLNRLRILAPDKFEITYAPTKDIRSEIAQFLVSHNFHILELIPKRTSLEDIMLKLSHETNPSRKEVS